MPRNYRRFIAVVIFSLAVFSTSRCTRQEPPTLEELETLVETLGGELDQNDEGEVVAVDLGATQVTDADLAHLLGLTALENLRLVGTEVTDAGLVHLAGLTTLENLILADTPITDAGLAHLTGLTELRDLNLRDTQVTDGGVAEPQKALPNCRIFPEPAI